jgi:hypothetical protein
MADDVSEAEQVGDEPEAGARDRRREIVIGVAAGFLVVLGLFIWLRGSEEGTTVTCTAAGAVGTPVAESSEAAFEAWFEESGPTDSLSWVDRSGVTPPSIEDYQQTSDTSWEWRYQQNAGVLVETSRRDDTADGDEQWAVDGVNGCTYS